MSFSLEVFEHSAVFRYPDGHDDVVQELDDLRYYHDGGRLTHQQYITELKDLVARHPGFIDGHAHLGSAAARRRSRPGRRGWHRSR